MPTISSILSSLLRTWLLFAIWAVLHSLLATFRAKIIARTRWGMRMADGWYRLFYNLFALVSFLPVLWGSFAFPDSPLYQLPPWAVGLARLVQLGALVAAAFTLWQVDLWRFLGVRQAVRWWQKAPEPRTTPVFFAGGFYAWVRHPLYFFSLLLLWATPAMTTNLLAFNLACTLYFYIGSLFEEKKLLLEFGEAYRTYQKQVGQLFPKLWH